MTTIEQIRAKIQTLQKQADALIAKQAQKVVDHIRDLMIEHGLTTADIEAAAKRRRQGASVAAKKGAVKSKLPPKYRNPKTGETWSGRARPPAWIANARDRSKFLIDASANGASKPKAVAANSAPGKPLYRDPETGKTWTGHGRAPAWIADAKDRSVFAIGRSASAESKTKAKREASKPPTRARKTTAAKKRAQSPKPPVDEPIVIQDAPTAEVATSTDGTQPPAA